MEYSDFIQSHNVSRETFDQLCLYHDLLLKWQKQINLISASTIQQFWRRHIFDSLQLTPLLEEEQGATLDLGSGGGLPAIPISIVMNKAITLVESDERKAIFLKECKRQLDIDIAVINQRIESLDIATKYDVVIARACASLSTLLTWSSASLSPKGKCLFPKGENYAMELEEASRLWQFDYEAIPSQTDPKAAILVIRNLAKR